MISVLWINDLCQVSKTQYLNYCLGVKKQSWEKTMLTKTQITQGQPLLTYTIASGNMRYIALSEREIYLRDDPQRGLIVQGEIPECGAGCYANLSQMLLEIAMTCEDCRDHDKTAKHLDQFGAHLGERLIAGLTDVLPDAPDIERLREMMDILLNSLGVSFKSELAVDQLRYKLAYCPIREQAKKSGANFWVANAHRAFVALCSYVVRTVAPEWLLMQPSNSESDAPLDKILITKADALSS